MLRQTKSSLSRSKRSPSTSRGTRADARRPSKKELKATSAVAIPIEVAAAKIRTGPPLDDDEDYALPIWAGVLPLSLRAGHAIPDPRLDREIDVPSYARRYRRGTDGL